MKHHRFVWVHLGTTNTISKIFGSIIIPDQWHNSGPTKKRIIKCKMIQYNTKQASKQGAFRI